MFFRSNMIRINASFIAWYFGGFGLVGALMFVFLLFAQTRLGPSGEEG